MKSFKLIIFAILIGTSCFAQQTRTESNHIIHANISAANYHVGLGYTYEWAFAPKWTLLGSAWMKGEFAPLYDVTSKKSTAVMLFLPTISAEPRFYYNFKRRESKIRSTAYNSGSYIAATFSCFLPSIYGTRGTSINFVHYGISPHWGMRRVARNKLFFEFHAGFVVLFNSQSAVGGIDLNMKFGYIF